MGQITIYVEDGALEAAKRAAKRAEVSASQWFAKFAVEEEKKQSKSWDAFFVEIDALRTPETDTGFDFLLGDDRYSGLGTDVPREPF